MMTDFHDLIQHDVIEAAKEKLRDVQSRRPLAPAAVADARAAVGPLESALERALAGGGGDIPACQAAMDAALKRVKTAEAIAPAIEAAIRQANDELRTQTGVAHRPMMLAAVEAMAASCASADALQAHLA